jgi:hypothetical protein
MTVDASGFLNRVLDSIPKPAMGLLGIMVGFTICFVAVMNLGGLQRPFERIIEAQVTRIEQSSASMTEATKRMEALSQDMRAMAVAHEAERALVGARITVLDRRVSALETRVAYRLNAPAK